MVSDNRCKKTVATSYNTSNILDLSSSSFLPSVPNLRTDYDNSTFIFTFTQVVLFLLNLTFFFSCVHFEIKYFAIKKKKFTNTIIESAGDCVCPALFCKCGT